MSLSENDLNIFYLFKAKYFYRVGNYSEAIKNSFECLLHSESINHEVLNILGTSLNYSYQNDLAKQVLEFSHDKCKDDELKTRIGGSLGRIRLEKEEYDETIKNYFSEKFNYTEHRDYLKNEHRRNKSDMIYAYLFEYKSTKSEYILQKVNKLFENLIEDFKSEEKEIDPNTLFYYVNLSTFLKDIIDSNYENIFLEFFHNILANLENMKQHKNLILPIALIELNLAKYYNKKDSTELCLQYLKSSNTLFQSLKVYKYQYQTTLYLSLIDKANDYTSSLEDIKVIIKKIYNESIKTFTSSYKNLITNDNIEIKEFISLIKPVEKELKINIFDLNTIDQLNNFD
jgi:hypothetical protein